MSDNALVQFLGGAINAICLTITGGALTPWFFKVAKAWHDEKQEKERETARLKAIEEQNTIKMAKDLEDQKRQNAESQIDAARTLVKFMSTTVDNLRIDLKRSHEKIDELESEMTQLKVMIAASNPKAMEAYRANRTKIGGQEAFPEQEHIVEENKVIIRNKKKEQL